MASTQIFTALAVLVAAAVLPTATPFTRYLVGDLNGWTTGVDYETWAKGYKFFVGDQLRFLYDPDEHNVYKVNETRFQNCIIPPEAEAMSGGINGVFLTTPGKHWFICGTDLHCLNGMKVEVTVLGGGTFEIPDTSEAPPSATPAATPANIGHEIATFWLQVLIVAVVVVSVMIFEA